MSEALVFALVAALSANAAGAPGKQGEAERGPAPVFQGERWSVLELRADPSARVFVIANTENNEEQNQCNR